MDKQLKAEQSQTLRAAIAASPAIVLVEFAGLTVGAADELRTQMREAGCTYAVYKNSMVYYAVEGTSHEPIRPFLNGVTGLAYHVHDPGAPARVARDFAKKNDKLKLKAAVSEGDVLEGARANLLADMPGPRELKSQLLRLFNTPATNMVRVISASARDFLNVLNAKKDKDAA